MPMGAAPMRTRGLMRAMRCEASRTKAVTFARRQSAFDPPRPKRRQVSSSAKSASGYRT
jgi:hypothetical protein